MPRRLSEQDVRKLVIQTKKRISATNALMAGIRSKMSNSLSPKLRVEANQLIAQCLYEIDRDEQYLVELEGPANYRVRG